MADHDAVRRGVAYLLQAQEKDGSWYGRWGVNYIYGSFLAMRGLAASQRGSDATQGRWPSQKPRDWLRVDSESRWRLGRICASYDRDAFRAGAAAARRRPPGRCWDCARPASAIRRRRAAASQYLLDRQRPDGTWPEDATTGTGFPNVFYLTYGMYRDYFPLLALAGM